MKRKIFGRGAETQMENRKFIESYLNDIRGFKPLTEERERELAKLIKNGSRRAEEELTNANLRLVVSIANSYGTMMPLEDVVQNGNIGLVEAVRTYDGRCRFVSYATIIIRKYIGIGLDEQARVVRVPANFRKSTLLSTSLDAPLYEDNEESTMADNLVGDDHKVNTDLDSLSMDIARVMVKILDKREIDVVTKMMGIGCAPMLKEQVAPLYNITAERVRQIYQDALAKLKADAKVAELLSIYL